MMTSGLGGVHPHVCASGSCGCVCCGSWCDFFWVLGLEGLDLWLPLVLLGLAVIKIGVNVLIMKLGLTH